MDYKWVLFDADETLFHFDNFSGLKKLFERYGVNFTQADFESYQMVNKPLWVDYQNGAITAAELQTKRFTQWANKLSVSAKKLNSEFLDCMAEICEPLAGAKELLISLQKKNIKVGIITNGFAALQKVRLERTGFDSHISLLVISELVGIAKPHRDIFQYAFEKMETPNKNQVLMVGDTLESDILGGNNFGFDTCWLNSNSKQAEHIIPTYEVSTLSELEEILNPSN
ncbi:pyrimidine 5'-nucleotidase [Marinomonas sp. C2222]|uniref:Pyrimidine 5'-nucleotidase n=1 Tax=Marinomonas sargassi TaxID=2984494 RepID=A0ABT2YSE6_9GAMM|nr:pyrimidine 5'-nucleotidase [Marinomonas sargassi]MCV2402806.1 pyrimidine 5'-nucleotidase [Marinomonas sargassi]